MATKKTTAKRLPRTTKAPAKAPAKAPRRTVRRRKESPVLPILLGIGGALAAGYLANSEALKKAVKEDKTRAALIGGLGVVGSLMLPKAAPVFAGVAIAGGTTLVQLMTTKTASLAASGSSAKIKGIGEVSEAQIEELRNRVRAAKSRMNGIPRGVMTGIPSGVIVGAFDDDMPRSRFA